MTDFLFLLTKINLAMAGAIVVVALLRRPVRAAFHAPIAYALWLLVPVTVLASLLPPRATMITAQQVNVPMPTVLRAAPVQAVARAAQAAPFDWSVLLFASWLAGLLAMLLVLAWQQRRFHQAEKMGAAGPAVTGFWRPRIVVPATFAAQFNLAEQAAILAHEAAHLARQDARINAVVAGLRCLCWFNPLVHLGALWLRKDQELACDAAALKHVGRADYANALLKSQMSAAALPLGCAWPGGEHPLTERVALLKRPQPKAATRRTGMVLIALLALCGGAGAWAAQPAQKPALPTPSDFFGHKPDCSNHAGFCGLLLYVQRHGDSGPSSFLSLQADRQMGHAVLHYPYGMALADSANYKENATITLSGHVSVISGLDTLPGQKLVFDYRTGMLNLDGKQMPSGMPKYRPCTKGCMKDGKPVN